MRRKMESLLLEWKGRKNRKPLLMHGARQVGKTYVLNEFAERRFKNTVYVNLETNLSVANHFSKTY